MPGRLTPYRDTTRPVVRSILFENVAGTPLSELYLSREVWVIADVYGRAAMPSRHPWGSMPVSPALIRWKLTRMAGRVLRSAAAVDFRTSLPQRQDFCGVYAPGAVQNFAAVPGMVRWCKPGIYPYDLTPNLPNAAQLHSGHYRFTVTATNSTGIVGT